MTEKVSDVVSQLEAVLAGIFERTPTERVCRACNINDMAKYRAKKREAA